eukprot:TRINITY_DN17328_c0_g1_i1.p1 TRINITY_DN17328_c0_g1~~TRINITY_DN17328_c0_g1_i1.p1  ORF type:complete len:686 (-),score=109.31 TRINITY_DN17328_c0_g1_i1:517-2574(-)
MPILVSFSGDEDFRGGTRFPGYMDPASAYVPYLPRIEVLCPSRKRLRGNPPAPQWEPKRKQSKISVSLDTLPEECLFEIFRRLPSGKDRSSCACVSKRWLMLQSSLRTRDFKKPNGQIQSSVSTNGETRIGIKGSSESEVGNYNGFSEPVEVDYESVTEHKESDTDVKFAEQEDSLAGDLSRCLEGKKATDIRLAAISVGIGSRWGLGKLKIRGNNPARGVTDAGLVAISNGCPSLRELALWDCPSVGDHGLAAIARGCPLLEKLDLLNCPLITDAGLQSIVEDCPKLSFLSIESCPLVSNKFLKAVGQCGADAISLSINNCPLVSDEGILSTVSPKLIKLKLQSLGVSDISLKAIGDCCTNLTELVLTSLRNVTQQGFQALGSAAVMQKLKVLSINFCKGLTDQCLDSIVQGCPNIKQSIFRKCDISDQGLKAFVKMGVSLESLLLEECNFISQLGLIDAVGSSAGKLRVLTIVKCSGITEVGLEMPNAVPACRPLKTLNVRSCPSFGNGCLALMGMACPQVQSLDLNGLKAISDDGLLTFLGYIKASLVKLNLSGCIELTDRAVFVIASLFGQSLETLNFEGCKKLTDHGLKFIADHCPNLQELDISKSSVTDNGLVSLAMTTKHGLQILSLAGCSQITDLCLPLLGKMSSSLHGLNVQQCSGINPRALDSLSGNLWRCDILS